MNSPCRSALAALTVTAAVACAAPFTSLCRWLATDVGWAKTVKLELAVAPDRQSVAVNLPLVNIPQEVASDLTVRACS